MAKVEIGGTNLDPVAPYQGVASIVSPGEVVQNATPMANMLGSLSDALGGIGKEISRQDENKRKAELAQQQSLVFGDVLSKGASIYKKNLAELGDKDPALAWHKTSIEMMEMMSRNSGAVTFEQMNNMVETMAKFRDTLAKAPVEHKDGFVYNKITGVGVEDMAMKQARSTDATHQLLLNPAVTPALRNAVNKMSKEEIFENRHIIQEAVGNFIFAENQIKIANENKRLLLAAKSDNRSAIEFEEKKAREGGVAFLINKADLILTGAIAAARKKDGGFSAASLREQIVALRQLPHIIATTDRQETSTNGMPIFDKKGNPIMTRDGGEFTIGYMGRQKWALEATNEYTKSLGPKYETLLKLTDDELAVVTANGRINTYLNSMQPDVFESWVNANKTSERKRSEEKARATINEIRAGNDPTYGRSR